MKYLAKNISPYLLDSGDIVVTTRRQTVNRRPIPEMVYGNKPVKWRRTFIHKRRSREIGIPPAAREPRAAKFVRQIYGSEEFINGITMRYCLWLKDANPSEWRNLPAIMERVQAVRDFRLRSTKDLATIRLDLPKFHIFLPKIRQPDWSDFI